MPSFNQQQVKEMEFAMQIKSALANATYQLGLSNTPTQITAVYSFSTGEVSYAITEAGNSGTSTRSSS